MQACPRETEAETETQTGREREGIYTSIQTQI